MRIQREGAQLQIRGTWSAGPGDEQARFLADLRALRDSAAIGYDELAARAHFPSDVLKEAENGPSLPGLPILTAYVRACEGDVLDWEERWRRLNPEVPDDPDLPVRPAGASAAAVAGARAGVGVVPPDVYDPERIRAALRGDQSRTNRVGRRTETPAPPPAPAAPAVPAARAESPVQDLDRGTSWSDSAWDASVGTAVSSANGNHLGEAGIRGPFDAAFSSASTAAGEPAADEEFSWLKKNTPEPSAPGADVPEPAEPTVSGFAWLGSDTGLASRPEVAVSPDSAITERIPRHEPGGLTSDEPGDFWTKPAFLAAADPAATAQQVQEPAIPRASWPAAGSAAATGSAAARGPAAAAAEPVPRATVSSALGSAVPARASADARDRRRQDRFFTARLLVVVVIAALIGSALVLLLK